MGEVYFYHLTESPLESVLPTLITRGRGQGWRIELRGRNEGRMAQLDLALWQGAPDGFLPHGLAGGAHDALQPVILTVAGQVAGPVECILAVDGAPLSAQETGLCQRCCIIFDGNDPDATETARTQWRQLTGAGIGAKYWAQDGGRWVMKQEKPAI